MIHYSGKKSEMTVGQKGFTLIEILIAMAIFSIGILGLYALQISSTNSNASARKRTLAMTWAQDRIEKLMKTPFSDAALIAGAYALPTDSDGIDNNSNGIVDEEGETGDFIIVWKIDDIDLNNDGENDAKSIRVQVNWNDLGRPRNTYLNAIKIDI